MQGLLQRLGVPVHEHGEHDVGMGGNQRVVDAALEPDAVGAIGAKVHRLAVEAQRHQLTARGGRLRPDRGQVVDQALPRDVVALAKILLSVPTNQRPPDGLVVLVPEQLPSMRIRVPGDVALAVDEEVIGDFADDHRVRRAVDAGRHVVGLIDGQQAAARGLTVGHGGRGLHPRFP